MAKMTSKNGNPVGARGKSASGAGVSPDERRRMIAEAAYYRALRRGFHGGDPVTDWLAAEREVNERLMHSSGARHESSVAGRVPGPGVPARPTIVSSH